MAADANQCSGDHAERASPLRVIISGAGIAGTTLAYFLGRAGIRTTLVETASEVRAGGNPVDVRGEAFGVAERMGVVAALRAAATSVNSFEFVKADGHPFARIGSRATSDDREVEIPRGDLSKALLGSLPDEVEILFGERIVHLEDDGSGVDVRLASGGERRAEIVIGADGLHSGVRQLAFGPESQFKRSLGLYIATAKTAIPADHLDAVQIYNEPGRTTVLHPGRGEIFAMFLCRAAEDIDHRDRAAQRDFIQRTYAGVGWRTPELLDAFLSAPETYFDSVSAIDMDRWRMGRIVLVGDAASCVSLFGDGSSLAIIGANALAQALITEPHDSEAAFARYEAEHRRRVMPRLRRMRWGGTLMVPSTRVALGLRNLVLRGATRFSAGIALQSSN